MAEHLKCGKDKTSLGDQRGFGWSRPVVCIGEYCLSPLPPTGTGNRVMLILPESMGDVVFDTSPRSAFDQGFDVCRDCPAALQS